MLASVPRLRPTGKVGLDVFVRGAYNVLHPKWWDARSGNRWSAWK